MKAILMSIRPRHVKDILNGDKILELRKSFPADYRGWIYIYVTKNRKHYLVCDQDLDKTTNAWKRRRYLLVDKPDKYSLNGKVVTRFYCSNVTEYVNGGRWDKDKFGGYDDFIRDKICEKACITEDRLWAYSPDLAFSAINIIQLNAFHDPRLLFEIRHWVRAKRTKEHIEFEKKYGTKSFYPAILRPIERAPQSWCYIEVEDE